METTLTKTAIARAAREAGGTVHIQSIEGTPYWAHSFLAASVKHTAPRLLGDLEDGTYEVKGTKATPAEDWDVNVRDIIVNSSTRDDLSPVEMSFERNQPRGLMVAGNWLYRFEREDGEPVFVRSDFLEVLTGSEEPHRQQVTFEQADKSARCPVIVRDKFNGGVIGLVMPHHVRE